MVAPTDYRTPTPNPTPGVDPQPPGTKSKPPAPKPPEAKVIAEKLAAGKDLKAGEAIRSANGQYELEMQKDGNLVLYDAANGKALWSSDTAGSGAQVARLGTDGNLQVLNGSHAVWSSHSGGCAFGVTLVPQDDGNLVLNTQTATPGKPSGTIPIWSSKTAALSVAVAGQNGPKQQQAITVKPTAASTFEPGLPELGIKKYTLHDLKSSTGSAWATFTDNGVKGLPGSLNDNLAATPYLDRKAFGTRPANPQDAVDKIPNGQQVTILDKNRLAYLERERTQLADVEHAKNDDDKTTKTVALVGTIEDELDYAGTQQAIPNADAIAKSISDRAPGDKNFQTAVQTATTLYNARLQAQGRTQDQIGKIQQAAAKGDWKRVQQLTAQQVAASVGKDTGSKALGDMIARGIVYVTYAGGNPKFAQAVQAGVAQAQQQVLVTAPIKQVDTTLKQHGGAAAMALLDKITDPNTALPGQVTQIMSDPTIQADIKQSLHQANWQDTSSKQMMNDLAAACQHSIEADPGDVGTGTKAVKAIADSVVSDYDKMTVPPALLEDLSPGTPIGTQIFSSAASSGNVALVLAVAAQAGKSGRLDIQNCAIDGARIGMDHFSAQGTALTKQAKQDAEFFRYGFHDFGGSGSPKQQGQDLQKMLLQHPKRAKTLNADGLADLTHQESLDGMRTAIAAFSPDLNGVQGFNVNVGSDPYPALDPIPASSKSILSALNDSPQMLSSNAAATAPTSSNAASTNLLWLTRSTRNATDQAIRASLELNPDIIKNLSKSPLIPDRIKARLFSKDGSAAADWAADLYKRFNKVLSGTLFLTNGESLLSSFAHEPFTAKALIGDAGYIPSHMFYGSTQVLTGVLPDRLDAIRPGSGKTALHAFLTNTADTIEKSGLGARRKAALTTATRIATENVADIGYLGVDLANAEYYASQGDSPANALRAAGDDLSVSGDLAFLASAGVKSGALGTDGALLGESTFLGLGEGVIGWTGVGAALMLAGSAVYTIGGAEAHSHQFDSSDQALLEAMGVHSDIAAEFAKHAFSLSDNAPSAGQFITAYCKTQQQMVAFMNELTPKQADAIATEIKSIGDDWRKNPSDAFKKMDDALFQYGIMPPTQLVSSDRRP